MTENELPEFSRTSIKNRKQRYNLTHQQFLMILKLQEYKCKLCKVDFEFELGSQKLCCVDHRHGTDEIRGLLCMRCNSYLEDFVKLHDELCCCIHCNYFQFENVEEIIRLTNLENGELM